MAPFQTVVPSISWRITCSLLVTSLFLSPAGAAEPEQVSIQTLLSPQAASYQQQRVMLEGVTSQLEMLSPAIGERKCPIHYGRATFVLEDETNSLLVEVLGGCKPSAVDVLPKDGDRVRVTGLVQVRKSEAPRDVRLLATAIQILELH